MYPWGRVGGLMATPCGLRRPHQRCEHRPGSGHNMTVSILDAPSLIPGNTRCVVGWPRCKACVICWPLPSAVWVPKLQQDRHGRRELAIPSTTRPPRLPINFAKACCWTLFLSSRRRRTKTGFAKNAASSIRLQFGPTPPVSRIQAPTPSAPTPILVSPHSRRAKL